MVQPEKRVGTRPNDLCPCGGGKKWKACHDPNSARANPREHAFEPDKTIDGTLVALCWNIIDLLDEVVQATTIPGEGDDNAKAARVTSAYLAIKAYRNIKAVLLLVLNGQSQEAFSLLRELYDFWIAATYYDEFPEEALLFVASEALRRRDEALRIMDFDPSTKNDPKRQAALKELLVSCAKAYKEVPGLRLPKGKSGSTAAPEMRDWSAPNTDKMLRRLMTKWDKEQHTGKSVEELEREALSAHFFQSGWISQEKHATQTVLSVNVKPGKDGKLEPVQTRFDDPNIILRLANQRGFILSHILSERVGLEIDAKLQSLNDAIRYHEAMNQ